MSRRHRPVVTVYTRAGCGLCRAAEQAAQAEAGRRADVVLVDVDADPDLQARYNLRVPVVAVDGIEVAELQVAAGAIRRAVRAARRLGSGGAQGLS